MNLRNYSYPNKANTKFHDNMKFMPGENWQVSLKDNANVYDSIAWIIHVAKETQNQPSIIEATEYASSDNVHDWAKGIFDFIATRIRYVADPSGNEYITTPDRLLRDGKGDCKKMTVFITAAAIRAGVPVLFRIIDYGNGWEHIYPIIPTGDGNYITMDVVNKKQFNKELSHVKSVTYNTEGEKVDLELLGNAPADGQREGGGTYAATSASIGRTGGHRKGGGTYAAVSASLGNNVSNDCYDLLNLADCCMPTRKRMGNNQAMGALFKMNVAGWQKVAGSEKNGNWAALLPLFLNFDSLPERLQAKYQELKTYVVKNSKKDLDFNAIKVGIQRGIQDLKGNTPQYLLDDLKRGANSAVLSGLGDMFDDLEGKMDDLADDGGGTVDIDVIGVVSDAIKGTETGTGLEGFLSKGLSWLAGLFKDKAITGKHSLQQVHPGLVFSIQDYAEIFYDRASANLPNLGMVGSLKDLTLRFYFRDNDAVWHELRTGQSTRPGAIEVRFIQNVGKALGFSLLNFTPKLGVEPIGVPVPNASVQEAVNYINEHGGLEQPLPPGFVIPDGMEDVPNHPNDENNEQENPEGGGGGEALIPAAAIAAFLMMGG